MRKTPRGRDLIGRSCRGAAALAALAVCMTAAQVQAADGDGYGFGPVLGMTKEGTWTLGWEASATFGTVPFIVLSVGGSYHLGPNPDEPYTYHYALFEPWLLLGGTGGFAVADRGRVFRPTYGFWEGFPIPLKEDQPIADAIGISKPDWMLTLAFGVRWFGGSSMMYVTPKLWRYTAFGLNS